MMSMTQGVGLGPGRGSIMNKDWLAEYVNDTLKIEVFIFKCPFFKNDTLLNNKLFFYTSISQTETRFSFARPFLITKCIVHLCF